MKIPLILAQEPVVVPQSRFTEVIPDTGLATIGRGLMATGDVLGQAAEAKRSLAAKTEAALRKSEFDVGLAELDSTLRLTHSDPDAYLPAFTTGSQRLLQETLNRTQSPDAKELLGIELARASGLRQVEAQKHYNTLFLQRDEGWLDSTLDNKKVLLGAATSDQDRARMYREGLDAIDERLGARGTNWVGDRKRKWRDTFLVDVESRKIDTDPLGWNPEAIRNVLPDDKIKLLEERADRTARRHQADRDRYQKENEHLLTQAKQQLVTDLESEAAAGTLTLETLELRREMRQLDPGDYRRLRKDIAEGGIQRPSDLGVMSGAALDVAAMRPRTTETDINRLHEAYLNGRPGLNLKDAQSLKEKLTTKLRTLENEGESDLVRDHNQAEQTIRAALGIRPGLIVEALKDDPAGRLYFAGLDELSRRSRLFQKSYGGTEDPLTVVAELVPRLQKAFGQASQPRLNELMGLLRYPTPQGLDQAFQAGQISESAYRLEQQRFLELDRLRKKIAPTTEPGAPKKPTEAKPRL